MSPDFFNPFDAKVSWGTKFMVMGGPVKLGFEWEVSPYRKVVGWEDSITLSEEIGNYVEKMNENNFIL